VVYEQAKLVSEQSALDDTLDEDDDGIIDVEELTPPELARRKFFLVINTIKEPWRIQSAVGSLWAAWLAVLATLQFEFARTTAMALGVVDMIKFPVTRLLSPPLVVALGEENKHWVPTILESGLSLFAIMLAWYLQMIVSAFYSALRGGRLFADAFFDMLDERGWINHIPGIKLPFDPNESVLDEIVGFIIAFQGFAFQLSNGFTLPFPFNLLMLPLTIVEWVLRAQISSGVTTG